MSVEFKDTVTVVRGNPQLTKRHIELCKKLTHDIMHPTIKVFLDDEREAPEGWIRTYTAEETIELLKTNKVSELSLDHDLGEGLTGYDVVLWIEEMVYMQGYKPPSIKIHSANPVGRRNIELAIKSIERNS